MQQITTNASDAFSRVMRLARTRPVGSQSRRLLVQVSAGYASTEAEQMELLDMALGADEEEDRYAAWSALYTRSGVQPAVLERMADSALDSLTDIGLFEGHNISTIHLAATSRQAAISSRLSGRIASLGPLDSVSTERSGAFGRVATRATELFFARLTSLESDFAAATADIEGAERAELAALIDDQR